MSPLKRFERFILIPVDIALGILIVAFLLDRTFLICIPLGVAWLLFGGIGQSIHRELTPRELARGDHLRTEPSGQPDLSSSEQYHRLAKALMGFGALIMVVVLVVAMHAGLRWYSAALVGFAAAIAAALVSLVIATSGQRHAAPTRLALPGGPDEQIFRDGSGKSYSVRSGVSVWLPEPVQQRRDGRYYAVRNGAAVPLAPEEAARVVRL